MCFARMAVGLASLLALACGAASAQEGVPQAGRAAQAQAQLQQRFAAADANGDGHLTQAEARAGMPLVDRNFARIDTAGRGYVTQQDIQAFIGQQLAARRGGER